MSKSQKRRVKEGRHNFWKGGIDSLCRMIKRLKEYKEWRIEVFKRDYYTCQECFQKSRHLEVHHIKSFAEILKEFLQCYSQFSPIEDKETLIRLAITYKEFWNIDNGITLCKKCHILTYKNILSI